MVLEIIHVFVYLICSRFFIKEISSSSFYSEAFSTTSFIRPTLSEDKKRNTSFIHTYIWYKTQCPTFLPAAGWWTPISTPPCWAAVLSHSLIHHHRYRQSVLRELAEDVPSFTCCVCSTSVHRPGGILSWLLGHRHAPAFHWDGVIQEQKTRLTNLSLTETDYVLIGLTDG